MANKRIGKCLISVFLILDNVRLPNKRFRLPSCLYKKLSGNISLKLWCEITVWENKKKTGGKTTCRVVLPPVSCFLFPVSCLSPLFYGVTGCGFPFFLIGISRGRTTVVVSSSTSSVVAASLAFPPLSSGMGMYPLVCLMWNSVMLSFERNQLPLMSRSGVMRWVKTSEKISCRPMSQ